MLSPYSKAAFSVLRRASPIVENTELGGLSKLFVEKLASL